MKMRILCFAIVAALVGTACDDDGTTDGTTPGPDATSTPDVTPKPDAPMTPEATALDAFPDAPLDRSTEDRANDGTADAVDGADGVADIRQDGLVCTLPAVKAYNAPGCGAQTPAPYCQ